MIANLLRLAHICRVCVSHGLAILADRVVPGLFGRRKLEGPIRLKIFLEDLGGSFVKFGQIMALQPDLIPKEYCNALFDLMDRIAAFPYDRVRATIIEDLGKPPEEIFDSFEPEALATASIGQVHIAVLNGQKVAVKVQRPNAQTETAGDVRIMATCIALIKFFHLKPLYWMIEPMSEFLAWTMEELDYRNEARYMEQIRINARGKPAEKVPEVFWVHTTPRILVVEFLEGITILDYMRALEQNDQVTLARLEAMGFKRDALALNIIGNFLSGSFNYGLFHADLHPANLLILPNNVVGYVDFGITGVISMYSREALITLTLAYTRADIDQMTKVFLGVSAFGAKADPNGLKLGLQRGAAKWYHRGNEGPKLKTTITRVMLDMLRVSKSVDIWPERDVIKYIRSAVAVDGLISRFAPDFAVGAALEATCDRYLKWAARRRQFSYDSMLETFMDSGRLAINGPDRLADLVSTLLPSERERTPVAAVKKQTGAPSGRTVPMSLLILLLCLLLVFKDHPQELGINLTTALLMMLAASLLAFLGLVRGAIN